MRRNFDKKKLSELGAELLWLFKYIKKYKAQIALYILIGIIGIFMSFASGISAKYLIDAVQTAARDKIVPAGAAVCLTGISSLLFNSANSRVSAVVNLKINNEISSDIFSSVLGAGWESVNEFHAGDILNRFSGDISAVVRCVINLVPGLFTKLVQFAGAFCIIFYYDRVMAFIALAGAPVLVLSSRFFIRRMRDYNREAKKNGSEIMSFIEEAAHNISFIKSFSLTGQFSEKYNSLLNKQKKTMLEFNRFSVYASAIVSVIGLLVSYTAYGWGVHRLWHAAISYGTMVLFLQLSGKLTSAFSAITALIPETVSAATSAGRLKELSDLPCENTEKEYICPDNEAPGIKFKDVSFFYKDGTRVFEHIGFEVKPGETVALVGQSGSGKTTMLRIILGLVRPHSGKALLVCAGESHELSAATRRNFSYVSQENMLFSGSIADNLRMAAPAASDEQIEHALRLSCADFVFSLPQGINSVVKQEGKDFSRGQVQRISIARALIADASVLLLDEATSSLDRETERRIIENIFHSGFNKTCILTSHRQSMVDVCDRVFKVENGTVTDVKEM